jgi:hypothetical protein
MCLKDTDASIFIFCQLTDGWFDSMTDKGKCICCLLISGEGAHKTAQGPIWIAYFDKTIGLLWDFSPMYIYSLNNSLPI